MGDVTEIELLIMTGKCYVFTGGDEKCTGIGYVIDKDIFELSKKALQKIDGKISEAEKIKMIDSLYTTEKLHSTRYYKEILNTLNYVENLYTNEMDKSQAKRMFRNINSITVIPEDVFEETKKK